MELKLIVVEGFYHGTIQSVLAIGMMKAPLMSSHSFSIQYLFVFLSLIAKLSLVVGTAKVQKS
jgi:hypothetical protein